MKKERKEDKNKHAENHNVTKKERKGKHQGRTITMEGGNKERENK